MPPFQGRDAQASNMQNTKTILFVIVTGILLGTVTGAMPYWDDIRQEAFPASKSTAWDLGAVDEQVMNDTADIERLLALTPPSDGASEEAWQNFLAQLNQVDTGKRYSNGGVTTPLLAWYAYIAKHRPEVLYKNLNSAEFDTAKFNHLLQMGMLGDWHKQVEKVDELLLGSHQALLSYALANGKQQAQRRVVEALFRIEKDTDTIPPLQLELENIRFAAEVMNAQQRQQLLDTLLRGPFKIDPRGVRRLALLDDTDTEQLRALIKKFQYPHKSMSSYMITAAQLGEADYVGVMARDVGDNASQPTNFYCSACGLALATDGLIGQPLTQAVSRDELQIIPAEKYGFVLVRRQANQMALEDVQ